MKHTLEEIQHLYPFKQPLRQYEMGVSGKPDERAQKSFVQCLMAEFSEELGHDKKLDIYSALDVSIGDFTSGATKHFDARLKKMVWDTRKPAKNMQKYLAMGYQRGQLDMKVFFPCGDYHGFFCEMKAGRNTATPEQKQTIKLLESRGFYACIGKEFAGALWHWLQYLEGKP